LRRLDLISWEDSDANDRVSHAVDPGRHHLFYVEARTNLLFR